MTNASIAPVTPDVNLGQEALDRPLEQAAVQLWLQRYPDQTFGAWPSASSFERQYARRRALIADRFDRLDLAMPAFREASLMLLYGGTVVSAERRAQVQDYVESFLEDLSKLFGDTPKADVPALTEAEQLRLVVVPQPNERVVVVPQCCAHLVDTYENEGGLVGRPASAIEPFVSGPRYGTPYWKAYEPARDPGLGYGLLVVRDGILRRGPYQWDSGD